MRTVSICIPTCDRAALIKEAIASCLVQTRLPEEVVIGDDSKGFDTERLVAGLSSPIPIRYKRNSPRLGQAHNVNSLFERAIGSHLILLHDDDWLLPNAMEDLLACWETHPNLTAAYGKQHIATDDGTVVESRSQTLNRSFGRISDRAGLQSSPLEVGILPQFPPNGYMVDSDAARAIGCRKEAGAAVDFDFGFRLSLAYDQFYFLDKYTSIYRITQQSVSNSTKCDTALQGYRILRAANLPTVGIVLRDDKLTTISPVAMMQAVRLGHKREAWNIYCSRHHGWNKRLSFGGVHRLARLLLT